MKRVAYLIRFFVVVPPMPLLMIAAFGTVVLAAVTIIAIDRSRAAGALLPVLVLQVFACATGFDVPARRGHYDLLLTHGETRRRMAVAHWAASALPGLASWVAIATVHRLLVGAAAHVDLFNSGTVTAVVLVSTIPWAATVALPRFSGAIGWLVITTILSLVFPDVFTAGTAATGADSWFASALAVLAFPPQLVGHDVFAAHGLVAVPALACAAIVLTAAIWSIGRRDIPLEAAQ